MDVYKLYREDTEAKSIDKEQFEQDTQCAYPWYQKNAEGEESHFAVCPACDNPIQLIGLIRLATNTKRPYGKHYHKTISNLAPLIIEERDYCPYFSHRRYDKADRKTQFEGTPRKVLTLLIEQFDRVAYILEKQTGLRFSQKALRGMLSAYRGSQGYLYMGATLRNVPWIFAYMTNSINLYGQVIKNTGMVKAITEHVPEAEIDPKTKRLLARTKENGKKQQRFDLSVCFIHHRFKKIDDHQLVETMKMSVSVRWDQKLKIHPIYEEVIEFDYNFFERLINKPSDSDQRNFRLVKIAQEELGNLLPRS